MEVLYADCRKVAAMAEEAVVILRMECHNEPSDWKESALALMKAVVSPSFGMCWQPNQLWPVEENMAHAKFLAPLDLASACVQLELL